MTYGSDTTCSRLAKLTTSNVSKVILFSKMPSKMPSSPTPPPPRRGLPTETKQCNNCSQKCFTQALYCRWCVRLDQITGRDLSNLPRHSECDICDGPTWVRYGGLCEFCRGQFDEDSYIERYGDYELKHRDQLEMTKDIIVNQNNPWRWIHHLGCVNVNLFSRRSESLDAIFILFYINNDG